MAPEGAHNSYGLKGAEDSGTKDSGRRYLTPDTEDLSISSLFSFNDYICLVTGGATGLGMSGFR